MGFGFKEMLLFMYKESLFYFVSERMNEKDNTWCKNLLHDHDQLLNLCASSQCIFIFWGEMAVRSSAFFHCGNSTLDYIFSFQIQVCPHIWRGSVSETPPPWLNETTDKWGLPPTSGDKWRWAHLQRVFWGPQMLFLATWGCWHTSEWQEIANKCYFQFSIETRSDVFNAL